MARLHPLTCKQVKDGLKELGFEPRPRTGTSHEKWVKTTDKGRWIVTVDCPKAPFSNDLIKSMAKQAGESTRAFHEVCAKY
ncbi:type II toxin-antitoxin system HicA family toxin [Pseudomonas nitroreducens]|uniref:Type II toxin-antitoxin system HicA family toxin n=1 Tax=Pseudomonas nitroreducens TaxID=46680 RepID=A0A6G6IUE0_PSENT|nr:type II toxin-antitoxin system HicA family toxin [Pseudomonas nitroreducens]